MRKEIYKVYRSVLCWNLFKLPSYPLQMNKEELVKEMERSIEEVISEAERLTKKEFKTQPMTGTWTTKEILSHIAAWDLEYITLSRKAVKGEPLPHFPDFDTFNAREVSKRSALSRNQLIQELRKNRKTYTAFLVALSEQQLHESEYDFTVESLARDIIAHDIHHLEQIRSKRK